METYILLVKVTNWLFLPPPGLLLALIIKINSIDAVTLLVEVNKDVTETIFVTAVVETNVLEVIDVDVTVCKLVVDSVVRDVNV
jgi:hypothetical protein